MQPDDLPVIETYSATRGGTVLRAVRLSTGRVVGTPMGRAQARPGETLDQRADRAFLLSTSPPEHNGRGSEIRAVDLYSGCGGLSLGLAEACRATGHRFRAVAAVDVDPTTIEIYGRNIPGAAIIQADVTELIDGRFGRRLTGSERALRRRMGRIDFLLAGTPCQGFSALNNHTRGADPKNRLYERVARAAAVLEPNCILIENVASVGSYSPRAVARTVKELRRLRYEVQEGVVRLVELGIRSLSAEVERVANFEGAVMIYSMYEGYRHEASFQKVQSFLTKHGIALESAHTSGHAGFDDLRRLVTALKPKVLTPIHTFEPDRYRQLWDSIHPLDDGDVFEVA